MLGLARQVLDQGALVSRTPDDELDQLVRATIAILLEGLEGGTETRNFVIETAVPAFVAQGETPATLAATSVTFAVMLSGLLSSKVSEKHRAETQAWIATFYGAYVRDVIQAAETAR